MRSSIDYLVQSNELSKENLIIRSIFHFLCKHIAFNCDAMSFTPAQNKVHVIVHVTSQDNYLTRTACDVTQGATV